VLFRSIENAINGSAKAWVNFNGTGTVAIRQSYNVSSITDNAVGDYTVNFTNALTDGNFSVAGSFLWNNNANQLFVGASTSSSVVVQTLEANAKVDRTVVSVIVFR
jgi:hypothetical protein